ncbi:MFS transporter, partial [Chloroflexota bacterium]
AVQSVSNIVSGLAADKSGSRKVLIISLVLISSSLFLLVTVTSVPLFYVFAIIYSFGIGGATGIQAMFTAELFGMKSHGVILGALAFGFTIGGAVGPLLTGYLFDVFSTYIIAFVTSATVGLVGIILTAILRPVCKKNKLFVILKPDN